MEVTIERGSSIFGRGAVPVYVNGEIVSKMGVNQQYTFETTIPVVIHARSGVAKSKPIQVNMTSAPVKVKLDNNPLFNYSFIIIILSFLFSSVIPPAFALIVLIGCLISTIICINRFYLLKVLHVAVENAAQ